MPKSTFDVLKNMVTEFRQTSAETGESLEAFSRRKYQDLNEPIRFEDLERVYQEQPENEQEQPEIGLPEEFRRYLIISAPEWEKREAISQKARQVKVDTKLIYEKRKPIKGPDVMGRSINETAYYLEKSGQMQLLEEYEQLMSTAPDEERDRKIRIQHNFGRTEVAKTEEQLKYERGHMLALLSERYMDVKPTDLLNLSTEEKVERMEEMEFIYAIACNLDTVLKGNDDILFREEDRLICEHMHSLMEVTGGIAMEYELMSNPCYKYLDLGKYFSDFDANHIGDMGTKLIMVNSDAISRLGMDFMMGGFRIQRQVGVRVEEELKNQGFDLAKTKYTKPDGTEFDPLGMEEIGYIATGGTFFAKDGTHTRKINADMKGRLETAEIEPKDYVMPGIKKTLDEFGMSDSHVTFMKEDKTVWDPEKLEDLEYFDKGSSIFANCGDKQVYIRHERDILRNIDKITSGYTRYHILNEEYRVNDEANAVIQQAQYQITHVEEANHNAAAARIREAEQAIADARGGELRRIRMMLKRSDPFLMKSSPEYKHVKRAMKAFSRLPKLNKNDPDNLQRAIEVLGEVLQNADTYLANKDRKATHSSTETSRMASIRRTREFAFNHLNRLNDMVRDIEEQQRCKGRIALQEAVIKEQKNRVTTAVWQKPRLGAGFDGGTVPPKVQKFFEERWKAAEKAASEKDNPPIPEVPPMLEVPPVPEEIKTYLRNEEKARKAEEAFKAAEARKAEEARKIEEAARAAEARKLAEQKFSAFQEKLDNLTDEKCLIENGSILNIDISLGEVSGESIHRSQYRELAVVPEVDPKEPLTEKQEKLAKQLLADVFLRRTFRNDQHAHPEHPEAGVIMQLSEKLSLPDYEYVVMETPTFKAMTEKLSRERLYDFVINLDTDLRQQTLDIMNEIPGTAKDLFAKKKIYVEPPQGNIYTAIYRSIHGKDLYDKLDLEPEVKEDEPVAKDKEVKQKDKPEAKPTGKETEPEVKPAAKEVKPAAKDKEAKPEVKPATKGIGRQ